MSRSAKILIFIILTLIVASCHHKEMESDVIEKNYNVNANLIKSDSDSLIGKHKSGSFYFDENYGYCKLINDSIVLLFNSGVGVVELMSVKISKGEFNVKFEIFSDIEYHKYKTIGQRLTLTKNTFKLNDTLVGEIYLKSICLIDSLSMITDTVVIKGKFKFLICGAQYNKDSLIQERNFHNFMKLTNENPDTITSLNLYKCGLKDLPIELLLFRNLRCLSLENNDLSVASFTILCNLKHLKTINFSRCNLKRFPDEIFCHSEIEELVLFGNDIENIPEQLFDLKKIKSLELGANKICIIPSNISKLKNLELLDLSFNPMKQIPYSITFLEKLITFFPPGTLDYMPIKLAKYLVEDDYNGIKNHHEFEKLIPKDD